MAGTLASLLIALGLDTKGLDTGLAKTGARVDGWARDIKKGVGVGLGLGVAGAAAMATDAVLGFVGDSLEAASNLNEAINKTNVVFEGSGAAMERWAERAADSFGQSKRMALENVATFGNLFDAMGIAADQNEEMSRTLVELASDLASFNNIDPTVALEKLQSGIVGETRAVRDLGIDIMETTVNAKLMEMGMKRVGGEFTQQQKILGRYALILEQTTNAQGDFARTAEDAANKARTLDAKIEDLQATVGEKAKPAHLAFLNALEDVVGGLSDYVASVDRANLVTDLTGRNAISVAEAMTKYGLTLTEIREQMRRAAEEAPLYADELLALERAAAGAAVDMGRHGHLMADAIPRAMRSTPLQPPSEEWLAALKEQAKKTTVDVTAEAMKLTHDYASALRGGQDEIEQAARDLIENYKHPISAAKRISQLEGLLAGTELANGLMSSNEKVRDAAREQYRAMVKELEDPETKPSRVAELEALLTATNIQRGLRSKDPLIRADTRALVDSIEHELALLRAAAGTYGIGTGASYRQGLVSELTKAKNEARLQIDRIRAILEAGSPPGPQSPLHLIDVWGERTGEAWVQGLQSGFESWTGAGALEDMTAAMERRYPTGDYALGAPGPTLSPVEIHVHVEAQSVTPMTPAEQEELGRRVGPAIGQYLREQGLV